MSLLKLSALLLLGVVTGLGIDGTVCSVPSQNPSSGGCPEHGRPGQIPRPASQEHECCGVGHNPALPTYKLSRIDALSLCLDLVQVQRFVSPRFPAHLLVTTNRSETPPTSSPIRI